MEKKLSVVQAIVDCAETNGREAAMDLVLLYGPDAFRSYDAYDEILCEMEGGRLEP